jgi:NitT/TauT family transport system substrate-binding protein
MKPTSLPIVLSLRTLLLVGLALLAGCRKPDAPAAGDVPAAAVLRVGFFPNLTHATALVGLHETSAKGAQGWFESRTGAKVEWVPFNAGPSAIEALLAGTVDVTYVGPSPVINGFTRTGGADIRVLAGATRGGAALVVPKDSKATTAKDFKGRKIASPQLGNTQDISARAWLRAGGLVVRPTGGDAFVVPTPNPDQLDLFKRGQLDGVWTVEPWVARLELDAEGKVLVEETDVLTTVVAASVKTLERKAELTRKFLAAHDELTRQIAADAAWAKPLVNAALAKATTRAVPEPLLNRAWARLKFSTDVKPDDFTAMQRDAKTAGLLPREADLSKLIAKP